MDGFRAHSETFYTTMQDDSGSTDVSLNLSIDGVKVMDRNGRLTKQIIPLKNITSWTRVSDRLTMFIKTPVDVEAKPVSFYAPNHTLSSMLDTLTGFCLQLVEIMEASQEQEAARDMRAVAMNGGRIHKEVKNADEVEFWHNPEKAGWLQSQGDVIKTWRKRWFVLKEGYLFRFLDDNVTKTSKPRGIVDLCKLGKDGITDGQGATNKPNCIKIGLQKGFRLYLANSETEMVEWISALESAVHQVMNLIAGEGDEPVEAPPAHVPTRHREESSSHWRGPSQVDRTGYSGAQRSDYSSGQTRTHPSPYAQQGSANYPGILMPPSAPQVPVYRGHSLSQSEHSGHSQQANPGSVYRDPHGFSYGMGSGTTVNGIAGVGGVRGDSQPPPQQQQQRSSLPATISMLDPSYHALAPAQQYQQPAYAPPAHGGNVDYRQPAPQQQPQMPPAAAQLPATLNVMSIIDQPPAQQPTYGLAGATGGYAVPQNLAARQWETLYAPDGRPYYYRPSTGETTWDPPAA